VEQRAKDLASEMPSDEALAQAEAEAVERERRAEERRRREAKIRADVAYRARQVDPFGIVSGDTAGPRATVGQLSYLEGLRVDLRGHVPSRSEASKLIDEVKDRRRRGLCTYKQARVLAKHGLRTDLEFKDASAAIDAVAAAGWKATPAIHQRWGGVADAAE